ncbi:glycosyl hydrolase family 28-related protein [Maribacter sp. TH_r10]|uniref:glycosyl hydrolase family 28-related protein n=1 Tax=Maribacter sp. TH_r10 TaxID=3082086 RepID=UPI0029539B56|nr:glycosyl hydrolase family 28-related protein [Maribacter sp. TH_r10]MDV7140111.1 glycosyl hydrolase family 28-related protein [Maribacter sp. TH_r10]
MTLNFLSPRTLLLLCFVLILNSSCSKDSDLLTDYVISETEETLLNSYLVDDSFTVSRQSSLVLDVLSNDNLENQENVEIIDATEPANGTVVVNEDDTITYTPDADLTEGVEDSFTYTVEVANEDATVSTETGNVTVTVSEESKTSLQFDFNVKDFGAKGDGVSDDRTAIQKAIDEASAASTPSNKKVLYFPSGTYMLSEIPSSDTRLFVKSNIIIKGELIGNDSISSSIISIYPQPEIKSGQILQASKADNWEFRDMTIDGNGGNSYLGGSDLVAGYAQEGTGNFLIQNSNNWKIDNMTGRNSWSGNIWTKNVDGFEITNSRSINTDCSILTVGNPDSYMRNGLIENHYVDGHAWSEPIALYRGSTYNIIIRGCTLKNKNHSPGIIIGSGFDSLDSSAVHENILIENNTLWKVQGGIVGVGGNRINLVIKNNKIYSQWQGSGIRIAGCTNCDISSNEIDTGWGGFEDVTSGQSTSHVEIAEGVNNGGHGIHLSEAVNCNVSNNDITHYGWSAIIATGDVTTSNNSSAKRF